MAMACMDRPTVTSKIYGARSQPKGTSVYCFAKIEFTAEETVQDQM